MIADIVKKNRELLDNLEKRKIFFLVDVAQGTTLQDMASSDAKKDALIEKYSNTVKELLSSSYLAAYPHPALFDLIKAIGFSRKNPSSENAQVEFSFQMSRINFMGTDGIRGKVSTERPDDCLREILVNNAITPDLIENCTFAFASLLADNQMLHRGDTVCIGNDGRDITTKWRLKNAAMDGFKKASLNVLDLGIIPTPFVPYKMLWERYSAGAMLTASHNPSNQNGIKFFLNGKKILPDGPTGDYALSAYIFYSVRNRYCLSKAGTGRVFVEPSFQDTCTEFMLSMLPKSGFEAWEDDVIVLDTANGAFTEIGTEVLERLGMDYVSANAKPDGYNINKNCGVSDLEGKTVFTSDQAESGNPFVKEVFKQGRADEASNVFGIALDGDGDRGFLVFYEKADDSVYVVDGDKLGFILARYFLKKGVAANAFFVSTIESDLMTSISAAEQLGLNTKIVSVGDKWIGHFNEGPLCVGLEVSGHLIFPIEFADKEGGRAALLTGNGLFTCLTALAAIKDLGLKNEEIYQPFAAGFSKTLYRFFIDKARFVRGSEVWNKDMGIIRNAVSAFEAQGGLPAGTAVHFEDKEDINVLYGAIRSAGNLIGCIVSRNSGTEDKNAVYALGKKEYGEVLLEIAKDVSRNHLTALKNRERIEYVYENVIADILKTSGSIAEDELMAQAKKRTNMDIKKVDFDGVLHGLKKEERIVVEAGTIRSTDLDSV